MTECRPPSARQKKNCKKKISYVTKKKARKAARYYRSMGGGDSSPYLCPVCSKYHLTVKNLTASFMK